MSARQKTWVSAFGFIILLFQAVSWAAPVPDTGQTKCYDVAGNLITCPSPGQPLYGQDANNSINPMSYTKLDDSGNTLSDSVTYWSMVLDNVTGLIWEMKTNKDGVKNYNDPHDADNDYTWYDSNPANNNGYPGTQSNGSDTEDFIKVLNDAKFGGYSDWRMPSIKELANIINYSITSPGPTINTEYFPNTQASYYWSSTTDASFTDGAWGVSFYYGYDSFNYKRYSLYARAVRGGQFRSLGNLETGSLENASIAAIIYTDIGDGTVTDTSTGLMWQQTGPSKTMTWEAALTYCEELDIVGYTDWRLPTIKELRSLADYGRHDPSINSNYFPNTQLTFYLSSTTSSNDTSYAWGMGFDRGDTYVNHKYELFNVRAVRGGKATTACVTTINENILLHIPYLSYANGNLLLWADLIYEYNPTYPTLLPFKLTNAGIITSNPSFSCAASTLSNDLKIHIPEVLLPDGISHLWVDLEYSATLSTDASAYFVVSKYGAVSN